MIIFSSLPTFSEVCWENFILHHRELECINKLNNPSEKIILIVIGKRDGNENVNTAGVVIKPILAINWFIRTRGSDTNPLHVLC